MNATPLLNSIRQTLGRLVRNDRVRAVPQAAVFFGALAAALLFFAYALSFSTGWALGNETLLGTFYPDAQAVNHELYRWALYAVLAAGAGIVFRSHDNRCFYLGNFLSAGATVALLLKGADVLAALLPPLRESYLAVNPFFLQIVVALNDSTIGVRIFDLGLKLAVLLDVAAAVVSAFTVFKIVSQIARAKRHQSCRKEACR